MRTDIDRIRDALRFIPVGGHDERVRVAFMLKSALGEAGRDLWDEWRGDRGDDEAASVWKSASETGPLKIGTLFYEAKKNGWRDDGVYQKPTPEAIAERQRIAAERAAQEEAKIARERADAASRAAAIWKDALPAREDHPYLARKQVPPVATLREIDAGKAAAILGYAPKSKEEPLTGRLLVVPVKQGDDLSTLELIDEAGRKAALYGRGTKAGGYWVTQKLPDGDGAGLTLLIGEGVATVLSAMEATGHPAVAALSSGNLPAVAKAMRERYPAAALVILADLVKATGAPDPHATKAAKAAGGVVAVPEFGPDRDPGMTDFNDMAAHLGLDAVRARIESATRVVEHAAAPAGGKTQSGAGIAAVVASRSDDAETIERLAAMSPLEYDRVRRDVAKSMGVRPATLDRMVSAARNDSLDDDMGFPDVEPWDSPIDPGALLSEISATLRRFIVCQQETADACALWVAMTWFMDVVQIAPMAVITAPEKRCGKSQLLSLLGKLSYRPLTASNISPAALFRAVDAWKPTLLVDEADAFMRDNEELRGILNAGHTRDSAYVVRVVGEELKPQRFNVWGAKALAGIGHLADTLMDRAIVLELRRKLQNENVERLRHAEPVLFGTLTQKLARFADDYRDALRRARPDLPASLNDRAQDNWEPLLAIADVAGGEWPGRARRAALRLSGSNSTAMTTGTELLADIKMVFESKGVDRISTSVLIDALCADTEAPWATYNHGRPISPRQVAKLLAGYGITSHTIRFGSSTAKGYMRTMFEDAFLRYLAPPPPASVTPSQTNQDAGLRVSDTESRHRNENLSETPKPAPDKACDLVTDTRGGSNNEVIEVEI